MYGNARQGMVIVKYTDWFRAKQQRSSSGFIFVSDYEKLTMFHSFSSWFS
jgi:hypothetical protein